MCYLGIDKAIEDPSVCLRALPAVLVAPIIYPFALARGIAGVGAKGFPGAWSATQKLSRNSSTLSEVRRRSSPDGTVETGSPRQFG
jgi:hypothetical protein